MRISVELKNGKTLDGSNDLSNEIMISTISMMLHCKNTGQPINIFSNGQNNLINARDISKVNIVF